ILITADDTTFASFPCLLQWHSTSDPNPDHVVSYDLILSTDSIFLESFAVPLAQDTSYSFDFQTTSRRPAPTGSVDYYWKVQARDDWNAASSSPTGVFRVSSCCTGIRGNANFDIEDKVNIADIAYLVDWLFGIPGGPQPSCREEGNANGDSEEKMSISDVTYLIRYLFGMPPGPVPPSCP
ncbi:MAG: hypothetical protein OEW00_13175, partial [candidate division Zixibacteria bacterium]|nr:hypothetical protein [candidate division Zixibacteria bacterium]